MCRWHLQPAAWLGRLRRLVLESRLRQIIRIFRRDLSNRIASLSLILEVDGGRPGDTETKSGRADGEQRDRREIVGKYAGDIASKVNVLLVRAKHSVDREEDEDTQQGNEHLHRTRSSILPPDRHESRRLVIFGFVG